MASEARDFAAWRLPPRQKSGLPHGQLRGSRIGPRADGALSQYLNVPPTLRFAGAPSGGLLALLGNPNQTGDSATMHTDAPSGFSVMGYQSRDIAFGQWGFPPAA